VMIGGTTDEWNPPRSMLDDFKSMADRKAERYAIKGEVEDKHEVQLNIYGWLLANTRIDDPLRERLAAVGYDPGDVEFLPQPKHLSIQGISMMHLPYAGTTGQIKIPTGKGMRSDTHDYTIKPVRTWPLAEVEAYIRPKVYQWYRWLILGEPPPVVPASEHWLCRGCAFYRDLCHPETER